MLVTQLRTRARRRARAHARARAQSCGALLCDLNEMLSTPWKLATQSRIVFGRAAKRLGKLPIDYPRVPYSMLNEHLESRHRRKATTIAVAPVSA
jgi:hypothetical protein